MQQNRYQLAAEVTFHSYRPTANSLQLLQRVWSIWLQSGKVYILVSPGTFPADYFLLLVTNSWPKCDSSCKCYVNESCDVHNYTKAARHAVSEFFLSTSYPRRDPINPVYFSSRTTTCTTALLQRRRLLPVGGPRSPPFIVLRVSVRAQRMLRAITHAHSCDAVLYACRDGTVVGGDVGIGCRRIRTAKEVLKCECLVAPTVGYALRFLATSIAAETLRIVQAIIPMHLLYVQPCSAYVVGHGIGLFSCVSFHYLDQHAAKNAPAFVVDSSTLTFSTASAS